MSTKPKSTKQPYVKKPRGAFTNPVIIPSVRKLGRSQTLHQSGRWRFIKKGAAGKKVESKKATLTITQAAPKYYTAEKVSTPKKGKRAAAPTKLRSSITPGTVLIVLAGRFKGKRVVFLKQLAGSGLLLVSGPYEVNGVPLRRFNQAYVIATSTKVDVAGLPSLDAYNDAYFARVENNEDKTPNSATYAAYLAKRKADQKAVDAVLTKNLAKTPLLKEYLASRWALQNGDAPHLLKF